MADDTSKLYESTVRRSEPTKKYSDLNLDFIPHPVSGDIIPLTGKAAVLRSLTNIISTNFNERLFQPSFGSNLRSLLFEPINPATQHSIKLWVTNAIEMFEPRVSIVQLKVMASPDEHEYVVDLTFTIDALSEIITHTVYLERLR